MALVANLELILDSIITGLDPQRIGPAQFQMTAGDHLCRTITLPADEFHTIEVGEMAGPYRFLMVNIHATESIKVGFGQSTPISFAPGDWSFWNGSDIPYAAGDGAESKLFYMVMNQT